ncbi:hypothetical protein ATL10_102310 [Bacillus sp. 196mf]|nr:hypothetical protein F8517_07610 [Bacillus thuringiensis]MCP1395078.1 hypothetical protein [Bacillus cereus]PYE90845.1 hypothetical protein ATL10_102310 [Bacillus sp. 196mf]TXR75647.1 hypothetical protein DN400_13270 [Bacillus sp. AR8-1]SHM06654.1 hypothetical protein SAMN04487918_105251 [Bacillus sp. bc15]
MVYARIENHIQILLIVYLQYYQTLYHSSKIEHRLSELIPGSVLQLIEAENENLQLTGPVIG